MSNSQIGILQTALFWSNTLMEVPSGLLADKFKRKYSVALGLVLISIAAFGYLYFKSFYGFLFLFILHGIGFAFQSGADSALLFDSLKTEKKEIQYISKLSKARNIGTLALAIAIYLGGELKIISWNLVYILFGIAMLLGALFILSIKEQKEYTLSSKEDDSPSLITSIKNFFSQKEGKRLLFFIFGMGFLEMTAAPIFIYAQKYFSDQGLGTDKIGIIIAISQLLLAGSYLTTQYFEKIHLSRLILSLSLILSIIIGAFFLNPPIIVAIGLFFLAEIIPNLIFVFTDNHINEGVPSKIRASTLSIQSFISSIFISFGFLSCGALLDHYDSNIVMGLLGVLPLIGIGLLTIYFRTGNQNAQ